jgi:hypothetical protein
MALVPRDVVFEKFGTVGGFRESWTAAVYILSADFTEQLPGDEDQMTPSGNPHCMPGQMQTNRNNFVIPLFVRLDGMKFHRLEIIILGTMKLVTMVTWNRTTCLLRMIKNLWCCILLETQCPL